VAVLLTTAGTHVPTIKLFEVRGSGATGSPEHTIGYGVKEGIIFGFTTIVIEVVVAHCPKVGVKV
jgi:hypothetical protein